MVLINKRSHYINYSALFHHSKSPLSSLIDKGLHICIKTFTNKNSLVVTNNNFRHLTAIVLKKYTYNIYKKALMSYRK